MSRGRNILMVVVMLWLWAGAWATSNVWGQRQALYVDDSSSTNRLNNRADWENAPVHLQEALSHVSANERQGEYFVITGEPITVPEGGLGGFYVSLVSDPEGTVEVTVAWHAGDVDISVLFGGSLEFDSSNHSTPQAVVLEAAEDVDWFNDSAVIRVSVPETSSEDVTATEQDNEPVPPVVFVDATAGGANDGTSWADAFTELADALSVVADRPGTSEIRVAADTYTPAGPGGERTATFSLLNGVAIYGGFPPGGGVWEDRDPEMYETILSGDLNSDDAEVTDPADLLDEPTRAENSYHVVTGSGTDETAILDGFTITASHANGTSWPHDHGGGMLNETGSPTATNCTFLGNTAHAGGAMGNYYGAAPAVTDCVFIGNSATWGGGMENYDDSSPTLSDCTFNLNSANSGGAGISNYNSNPTLDDCSFDGNSAGDNAGAIWNDGSSPALTGCAFTENSAYAGGGIYNANTSSPSLTDCAFSGNWAGLVGGAMMNHTGSNPTLTACTFTANSAGEAAGGMHNGANSSPVLTDCSFTQNSAPWRGGGMDNWDNCNPTLTNCVFTANTTENLGGGMFNWQSNPALTTCTFSNNTAAYGGGMYNDTASNPTLDNCTFNLNSANSGGAGISNYNSNPTLDDCSFDGNSTGDNAGAI
ncbi:MAG: right-handed parallel beta-helix repeat-containing protein, partial [Phycisphaerae bacterium]|nr:right-handed parallel beta-helix repeat-containing protein [Phycisphaerae bacterium]